MFVVGGAAAEPAAVAAADEAPDGAASVDGEPAGEATGAAGDPVGLVEQAATRAANAIVAITLMLRHYTYACESSRRAPRYGYRTS